LNEFKEMIGNISHIIVIESLDNERKTGTELYHDCIKRYIEYHNSKITHNLHSVNSKLNFIEILNYYVINSPYMAGGLLIHVEMHGADDKSGLVLSDGSIITWSELVNISRQININNSNNLYLTLATCFGRYLYRGASLYEKSPYSCYISTSTTTVPSEIVEQFSMLFENLIQNGNLVNAYLEMEKLGTKFHYKDSERTFEFAFRLSAIKMKNDKTIRKVVIQQTKEICEKEGIEPPPENSYDIICDIALKDAYEKGKQSFYFE